MILDRLFRHSDAIKRHRRLIKAVLVVVPLLTFRITKQSTISSNEPVQHYVDRNIEIVDPSPDTAFFANGRFVLNDLPPRLTLRIQGRPDQEESYYPLISTLVSMDIRNINVIIDLGPPDGRCMYLFEIDLSFGQRTCMFVYPLKNHQPNSDLLLVAEEFFPCKVAFDPLDVLLANTPSNRLYIMLKRTPRSLRTFMSFVRSISFVRTHPYGSYFYIPVCGAYINVTVFLPAVLAVLAYHVLDWVYQPHDVSIPRMVFGALLYSVAPVSFLLFLRRSESLCFAPIFMVLNPKIGLAYIAICYLRMVQDTFAKGVFRGLRVHFKRTKPSFGRWSRAKTE